MKIIEVIFQSVRTGDVSLFSSLIDNIDVNSTNEFSQNMLHEAIAHKQLIFVDRLLSRKINVDQKDHKGQTPLHYCAMHNFYDAVFQLIASGANIFVSDDYGNEALWTAVFNARGKYDTVKILVQRGANVNHKNKSNRSPLDFAIQIEDEDMIALLRS
ncbi:ankyrin repeat domain-containing protein [Undibacterium aquatile]|uniref:Ankyrin repeat domain-containing protein n=1 Tax=Undibacterium aquatile TaxID=1537398 RepID=A0ABR6XF56_9BURK|nr:ankyrin repeat domain-containing protein [Undibacterium aquatile]MBC3811548.1 ankyrin repeat domain-containing protein [Undibacterium aquatile]